MKTICLIGKPNVGKSSIFNRLIREKKAIIMDTPGITRDRIYGKVNYQDKSFYLIDTGGISLENANFDKEILMQAQLAMDEADIILFVVDGLSELDQTDLYISNLLHKTNKEVIIVVNKLDNEKRKENIYNYYELGFSNIIGVSAEHNLGIDELLKEITKDIEIESLEEDNRIKFCIIGRPNVGKSSLINALINEERVIVSDVAGTTRDAVDTTFKYNHEEYVVIDTAGMRKKGKIYESVEKYSLVRSLKAIDRSDVCVVVLNAVEGIIEHDKHIISYAIDAGKGIVICVNKWDTINNPDKAIKEWQELIKYELKFVPYAKTVFVSALTKKRVNELMPEIINAYENNKKEVKTSVLNNIIMDAVSIHQPPSYKGRRLKIYFVHQVDNKPPKFELQVNDKKLVHFSYERYLENQIRDNIDFSGTPIILQFKNKGEE